MTMEAGTMEMHFSLGKTVWLRGRKLIACWEVMRVVLTKDEDGRVDWFRSSDEADATLDHVDEPEGVPPSVLRQVLYDAWHAAAVNGGLDPWQHAADALVLELKKEFHTGEQVLKRYVPGYVKTCRHCHEENP